MYRRSFSLKLKPRFHEKFLSFEEFGIFVHTIFVIVEEYSPSADEKRSTEKLYVIGVTLPMLRAELKKISLARHDLEMKGRKVSTARVS